MGRACSVTIRPATIAPKYLGTDGSTMGELVNLRKARKQAQRNADEERAASNRLVHGRTKAQRTLEAARTERTRRHLEAHKIDTGEG